MTRRAFGALLAVPWAGSTVFAAETPKERGRRLIDKVIEGLGGDAFRTMSNCTESGRAYSFYRDRLKGLSVATIYTRYLDPTVPRTPGAKPGLFQLQRQVFGKQKEDAILFTQAEAYEVTFRGARPLGEDRFNQYRDSTLLDIFYILRERVSEPGIEFESAGSDVVENQSVETINIYDTEDRKVTVWVNAFTFLPVKQRYTRWDPTIKDRREEVTHYAKYRDAGQGVMWPFDTLRERDSEKIYQLFSDKVTVNDPLPESFFELPNGIKILKT